MANEFIKDNHPTHTGFDAVFNERRFWEIDGFFKNSLRLYTCSIYWQGWESQIEKSKYRKEK